MGSEVTPQTVAMALFDPSAWKVPLQHTVKFFACLNKADDSASMRVARVRSFSCVHDVAALCGAHMPRASMPFISPQEISFAIRNLARREGRRPNESQRVGFQSRYTLLLRPDLRRCNMWSLSDGIDRRHVIGRTSNRRLRRASAFSGCYSWLTVSRSSSTAHCWCSHSSQTLFDPPQPDKAVDSEAEGKVAT